MNPAFAVPVSSIKSVMVNNTTKKRIVSIFLPIKKTDQGLFVFLQKRSADMERLPNFFSFWGGGVDSSETPEQGLVREVREELGVTLDLATTQLFSCYEFFRSIKYVFIFFPAEGWEKDIVVGEGEYGQWFSVDEAFERRDIIFQDKVVLNDLQRELLGGVVR